jgi:hypothetical protein
MSLKNALRELLNNLDKLDEKHGGIGDTVVREQLSATMIDHFVLASSNDDFPLSGFYVMPNDEADQEVHNALRQFLNHPETRAALAHLTPQERLDAFQDEEVESTNYGSTYDNYFGWVEHL